ncbi:DUF4153 domain-containing protein [Sphingomonas populi]|uniref:DUF4153 domain-containing protein n=1 Tax=Sphingomonas populi TaxID=2484750 RepID=A0A4Q6Y3I4_9SPHN|nr:DUF4153 domain-containing protein [Sphingomonas populi]
MHLHPPVPKTPYLGVHGSGSSSLVAGFVVERGAVIRAVAFAAATGTILGLVTWWNIPAGRGSSSDVWPIVSALLAIAIAVPVFQTWQRDGTPRLPYPVVHRHAWTGIVRWFAAWVFVAVVWMLALLLGELFALIGLGGLRRLLGEGWMVYLLTGAALGGAIGLLRDRVTVLTLLQRVVTTILAMLAPVLAAGLLVFLAALPFTGLAPMWEATRATTPILLCCIAAALILTNAVIGDTQTHEPRQPVLRASAMVLAGTMLPLGIIAAISTGLRIHQHGLSPDRLWALTFVMLACAYGTAYAVALVRRRTGLAADIRRDNLRLAIGVGGVALLLATPLVAFGRLSTRDQLARLESGTVSPEAFDWTALRFDFGRSGEAATRWYALNSPDKRIRVGAATALAMTTPSRFLPTGEPTSIDESRLIVLPRGAALPPGLRARLPHYDACFTYDRCAVLMQAGGHEAVIVNGVRVHLWREARDASKTAQWVQAPSGAAQLSETAKAAFDRGEVEMRTVTRRQIFLAGQPVGEPFE